jgi:hypothetical protein
MERKWSQQHIPGRSVFGIQARELLCQGLHSGTWKAPLLWRSHLVAHGKPSHLMRSGFRGLLQGTIGEQSRFGIQKWGCLRRLYQSIMTSSNPSRFHQIADRSSWILMTKLSEFVPLIGRHWICALRISTRYTHIYYRPCDRQYMICNTKVLESKLGVIRASIRRTSYALFTSLYVCR